ncbi:MAG: hypothetical protein H7Z43_09800 [Clostridia bacterium]|nr:hypothetical protein [Deltaproteobacteria bacterium]
MPKRGDRVAAPPKPGEWELRFGDGASASGWEDLCAQVPGPTREAYDSLVSNPRSTKRPGRQHRLKGQLAERVVAGETLEQWQFEVTGGRRVWYCIDDAKRRVVIVLAAIGHPKATE